MRTLFSMVYWCEIRLVRPHLPRFCTAHMHGSTFVVHVIKRGASSQHCSKTGGPRPKTLSREHSCGSARTAKSWKGASFSRRYSRETLEREICSALRSPV